MAAFNSTLTESEAPDGSAAPAARQPWHRPQVAELPPDEAATARRRAANLDTASELAASGLPIFPAVVEPRGDGTWSKRPLIAGWQQRATTDAAQIRDWWQSWPDAVPGIELGRAGLVAVDADRHGGPDGVTALENLAAAHGGLPAGPVTETPTGGRHYIYRQLEGEPLGNRRGSLPPGIDVRGAGGWIVAPGAARPDGKLWAPMPDTPSVAEARVIPNWLVAIIRPTVERPLADRPPRGANGAPWPSSSDRGSIYARQALRGIAHELRHTPPNTCRNERLNTGAYRMGRMVACGWIARTDVADELSEAAIASGLDVDEVQRTLASGLTAGMQKPADELDRPHSMHNGNNGGTTLHVATDSVWTNSARPEPATYRQQELRTGEGLAEGGTCQGVEPHASGSKAGPDMSIVRRNRTPAPEFPIDVLGTASEWVKTTAESKSAPISYIALGLFVSAAGCIGAKRRVSPWDDWFEPSILWGALVGEPSLVKSPSMDPFRDAVRAIERGANANWSIRQAEYEKDKQAAEARRIEWEQKVREAVKAKQDPPPLPPDAVEPNNPARVRLCIVDATSEKVARILGENPAGLISFRDELAGLFGGFDRYGGSGSDRAFWIEAYGGRPYRYDRVSLDDPIDIPFCAVSLLGALQPDRLNRMLLSGDDDGLAARPLYAWPDPVPPRRPSKAPDHAAVQAVLKRLWDLPFDVDAEGNPQPRIKLLEPDAADEFQTWYERTQWNARLAAGGRIAGAIGKLDGVALRLAQVLELLQWAWSASNQPEPDRVSAQSVKNALRIIDDWVRPNLERVFAEASLPQAQRDAMTVGRWLLKLRPRPKTGNARDLRRQPGFPGPKEAKELDAALEVLVDALWLRPKPIEGPGRPRKDYEVNEAIYEEPAKS